MIHGFAGACYKIFDAIEKMGRLPAQSVRQGYTPLKRDRNACKYIIRSEEDKYGSSLIF